jgi:hypothetical protein
MEILNAEDQRYQIAATLGLGGGVLLIARLYHTTSRFSQDCARERQNTILCYCPLRAGNGVSGCFLEMEVIWREK